MKWKKWRDVSTDESHWQDHFEKGLLKAEHIRDYILQLWFEEDLDVSIYELDFYPLLMEEHPGDVLLPLRDQKRFKMVKGDYTLTWLNPETGSDDRQAIALAPECIRFFCNNYGRKLKTAQHS